VSGLFYSTSGFKEMIDLSRLSRWVQPRQLDAESIQANQQKFISHQARMIVLKDFLQPEVAERLSRFLTHEATYTAKYGLYSNSAIKRTQSDVIFEEWERAPEKKRFYRFGEYSGLQPEFKLSLNAVMFLKFRTAFYTDQFKELFEQITGLTLKPGPSMTGYVYKQGDYLRDHDDTDADKRLAYVLYLNPQWKPFFGGALHMIGSDGEVTRIEAQHNSLILFDVRAKSKHFVAPINSNAGEEVRTTLSGWWHEPLNEFS
jgi:Rps23 Pro-64 3,4-dihydroxylase Tpa1-like proline 4-hydroxylase